MYKFKLSLLALAMVASTEVMAASADEIQVYDEAINKKGELNVDIHMNYINSGINIPDYVGEMPAHHSFRITPEFAYGFTNNLEGGLYIPVLRGGDGNWYSELARVRLKYIGDNREQGLYWGINFEHYSDFGNTNQMRSISQETYLTADTEVLGHDINIGVGHGWTGESNNWIVKTIFNIPL